MKAGKKKSGVGRTHWAAQAESLLSRPLIISLLLALVTLVIYWPVQNYEFLGYDDPLYYTQNAHVLSGLSADNVVWAITTGAAANWHPLTWLSLMLDAEFFGDQPGGPHLVNLLFHIANTVLVFVLFRRLTAMIWRSALVAALFALHPLHVESVAWIAERKDLLCGFFVLLTLLAYARAVGSAADAMPSVRRSARFYILSLVFFTLALMSKPMAVSLPCVLLLLDWWPLNRVRNAECGVRNFGRLTLEKTPFLGLAVAVSAVTFVVQQRGGAMTALAPYSLPVRLENALVSYASYLAKTFWPATLASPYPYEGHWPAATVVFCGLLFAGLCVVAVVLARRFPFVFTGWFWFAGMLVPVIGLVQVGTQSMADRYMYLPSIGLFVALVWGLAQLAAHWNCSKVLLAAGALALLAGNAARTRDQLAYWQNDGTLFSHSVAVTRDNLTANVALGSWYFANGNNDAALEQYRAALNSHPDDPLALYDLANVLASQTNYDEAIRDYHRALQLAPGRPNTLCNLAGVLVELDRLPEAITNYEAALAAQPDSIYAHNGLGVALFKSGRFDEAARHFAEASKLAPNSPKFAVSEGDALARLGKLEAAAESYRRALQLDPSDSEAAAKLNSLGAQPGK